MSDKFKITGEEINQTLMHSPYALSDSPYQRGLGAGQIKRYFYDFITGVQAFSSQNGNVGPFGVVVDASGVLEGDVVQLADSTGEFYHSLIITGFSGSDTLVSAHTNDALDKPLSSYNFASLRYIHIEGVRLSLPDDTCFTGLIEGRTLSLPDEFN